MIPRPDSGRARYQMRRWMLLRAPDMSWCHLRATPELLQHVDEALQGLRQVVRGIPDTSEYEDPGGQGSCDGLCCEPHRAEAGVVHPLSEIRHLLANVSCAVSGIEQEGSIKRRIVTINPLKQSLQLMIPAVVQRTRCDPIGSRSDFNDAVFQHPPHPW
eukprot:3676580-Rhodomonas_salina.1